jgi:hypothetical protein
MSLAAIEGALARWKDTCQGAFEKVDNDAFELNSVECDGYKGFLRFETYDSGELYLHYIVPVAVIEDIRATPQILAMNRGGAKDSNFFFSISKQPDRDEVFLLLEIKSLDRTADEDVIFWRLSNWWENPIFLTPWEMPEGVIPIHPGFRIEAKAEESLIQ